MKSSKIITDPTDPRIPVLAFILVDAGLAKTLEAAARKCRLELWRRERYILIYSSGGQAPVGLVSWRMDGDFDHGVYELTHIAILQDFQRQGYGRELLQLLRTDAEFWYHDMGNATPRKQFLRTAKVEEGTHSNRPDAKGSYLREGYLEEYVAPRHFRDNRDEVILAYYH